MFCDVVFDISSQGGSNVSYFYDFDYDNVTTIQYDPESNKGVTAHRFMFDQSGPEPTWEKNVKITAYNRISSFTRETNVVFIPAIRNFTLVPNRQNVTTMQTFSIMMKVRDYFS